MDKVKQNITLWLPYAALSGWLMCFMRVCFRMAEHTGLLGRENSLFIAICAGIVLGMILPLPNIRTAWHRNKALFRLVIAAAIPCTVLAVNTRGSVAIALTLLASFFASTAMGCSLYRISLQLDHKIFGLFFGVVFSVSEGLLFILLLTSIDSFPAEAIIGALCLLLFFSALFYRDDRMKKYEIGIEAELTSELPSKSVLIKYLSALLLYSIMGGMLDNLTAFDDAFFGMPNMIRYVYLYSITANLIFGILFRPAKWNKLAMLGILLICVGQALPYFSTVSVLAVPYLVLTILGVIVMEFIVRSIPVLYAHGVRAATVSRLGYASLYGGFLLTSVLFEYLPRGRYFFVMGIVLVLAFIILSLLYMAFSEEERNRYNRIMRELRMLEQENARYKEPQFEALDIEAHMEQLGLTAREREVCALLLNASSLKQVAAELQIAYGTANKHYTSIYRKLGISSKAELFQIFGVSLLEHSTVE